MNNPTSYVPRYYRPRVSTYWWVTQWAYFSFILREISSIFVAWGVIVILLQIRALELGPADYAAFQQWLARPGVIAMNMVSFFFVLLHTVTWFNLAPKAMVIRLRGKRLPSVALAAQNYGAWLVLSAIVAWVVLRG